MSKKITYRQYKALQETCSPEYHLVNSIFELSDKRKEIAVIFRVIESVKVIVSSCLIAQILSLQDGIHQSMFLAILLQVFSW